MPLMMISILNHPSNRKIIRRKRIIKKTTYIICTTDTNYHTTGRDYYFQLVIVLHLPFCRSKPEKKSKRNTGKHNSIFYKFDRKNVGIVYALAFGAINVVPMSDEERNAKGVFRTSILYEVND